jgi:hypothetical protein
MSDSSMNPEMEAVPEPQLNSIPSSTMFSTPETQAHMTLASPGSPLPFVGDQTLPAEGNLRDQVQMTSVTDQQWEMLTSFGLGSVDPEMNDEM